MVLVGLFFCVGDEGNGHHACMNGHMTTAPHSPKMRLGAVVKTAGVHGRHGVVEKKQSGVGDKGWFGMRMVLFGERVWYNRVRQT